MKRFLKIVGILALFAVVIAYFAFRVVFFDPFGGAHASLDPLIPKDVDFMLRRKELAHDVEPFPMPRFFKTLRLKDEWKAFTATKAWRDLEPGLGVAGAFAELERIPAQIEPIDVMNDVAGREVMLVGRWRADGTLAWAAIARGSFRAKLLAEALKLGVVRNLAGDALKDYAENGGVRSFTAQGRRWHLARSEDALIAGNDFDLVSAIAALDSEGAAGLDKSPQFRAAIAGPSPMGRPIDFVVDVADACRNLGVAWPAATEHDPLALRFARELLKPEHFSLAMGRVALGSQIELSTIVAADRVALAPASGGMFGGASTKLVDLHEFCGKVFPARVALCGYVRLGVKDFLRRIESLLGAAERQLLNDFVVSLKSGNDPQQPRSTVELLDAFSRVVTDEFAFAIEPDEAYKLPDAEEGVMQFPDPHWGPRVAFIFPVADKEAATRFVDRLVDALRARHSAISNVFRWTYASLGVEFREIKTIDPDLPTISIGILELQKRDCVVITTTGAFLDEIVNQKQRAERGDGSGLQSELSFRQAAEAMGGFGQGFLYVSAVNLRKVFRDLCVVWAEDLTRPEWVKVRREVERKVAARSGPGLVNRLHDESVRKQIEPEVDREIEALEKTWKDVTLPAKTEKLRADLDLLQMVRWLALTMRVGERDLELRLRLATPANFTADVLGGE